MVFVSEHYREMALNKLDISADMSFVVPNMIDTNDFDRAKLPGAENHIGIVGIVPFLKRPDRAVDVLKEIVNRGGDYYLHIKGQLPWDYGYVWKDKIQRQLYIEMMARIAQDRDLAKRIIFDGFGADMASWLRQIGFDLSTSENESFHLAPAEGMASGAVPVVWQRLGSDQIFGSERIVNSSADAAEYILNTREHWQDASRKAKLDAKQWDKTVIVGTWKKLLSR